MQGGVLEVLLVVLYMIKISTQNSLNFTVKFGSKAEICWKFEELVYIGVARGIWAMHFLSFAYFGEIIIFGLSKDQAFRIWSTFMNTKQFLILVTH